MTLRIILIGSLLPLEEMKFGGLSKAFE
jgi:hypothetical protein